MVGILKLFYSSSVEDCVQSIIKLLEKNENAKFVDVGCSKGDKTLRYSKIIGTKNILGIEIEESAVKIAKKKGIEIVGSDLNKKWNFKDNSIDVLTANQVIEHLYDTDNFVKEIKRILKPGGYAIISTNNLSSWHNFVPLLLGYQPFPNDVSNDTSVGKLIKLYKGDAGSWAHLRIFAFVALKEIFEYHGFEVEKHVGVGYYPMPKGINTFFAFIDRRHAVYQTIKVRKIK